MSFPVCASGKEPACQCQCRRHKKCWFDHWLGKEDPLEKGMATHSVFLPGESHGHRSLVGYSLYHQSQTWLKWLSMWLVQFSHSVVSDSLQPHGLQHTRLPCPSPTPGVYSNSYPLSQWCHPAISSSVIPFSSCLQSFPASGSFPVSQFFASGGQSIGVSASTSVLPKITQDWSPSGWTGWISLQSKGLSRVFSNTTVQKHQFFAAQLSLCGSEQHFLEIIVPCGYLDSGHI